MCRRCHRSVNELAVDTKLELFEILRSHLPEGEKFTKADQSKVGEASHDVWIYVRLGYEKQLRKGLPGESFAERKDKADAKLHELLQKLAATDPDLRMDLITDFVETTVGALLIMQRLIDGAYEIRRAKPKPVVVSGS